MGTVMVMIAVMPGRSGRRGGGECGDAEGGGCGQREQGGSHDVVSSWARSFVYWFVFLGIDLDFDSSSVPSEL
jgi:hypothetical protein